MDKILFIIYNGEIRFVPNRGMSCKEFYISLGGNLKDYDNTIRGMIKEDKIIFMKANYQYDSEVIAIAKKCAPAIREQLKKPDLITCCGIVKGMGKDNWKPALVLSDEETLLNSEQQELISRVEHQTTQNGNIEIFDYKNDINDDDFAKYATRFSIYIFIANIIIKVFLITQHKIDFANQFIALIVFVQAISLILCIFGYKKKRKSTRLYGLIATAALILLLDLPDIILGIINLLFTIDQTYIVKMLEFFHNLFHKKKEK